MADSAKMIPEQELERQVNITRNILMETIDLQANDILKLRRRITELEGRNQKLQNMLDKILYNFHRRLDGM